MEIKISNLAKCGGKLSCFALVFYFCLFLIVPEFLPKGCFAGAGEDEPSLTLSVAESGPLMLSLTPGSYGTVSQTYYVTTTNDAGYSLTMETVGQSTGLVQVGGVEEIPTLAENTSKIITEMSGEYGYSLNQTNFLSVPELGEQLNLKKTSTASTTPDETVLTFGVNTPISASAGVYQNTFLITAAVNPTYVYIDCDAGYICYSGNNDDGTGTMSDQEASSNTNTLLTASNFSRPGYGFKGWNTKPDGTGTAYGASETIRTGDLSEEGLALYAQWVAPSGIIQNWTGCSRLSVGETIALKDFRDGEVYAVAKLADGKCWMVENSRLNPATAKISKANTNSPTDTFIAQASVSASEKALCALTTSDCLDSVQYNLNNMDRSLTQDYVNNGNSLAWYSYGGMYNWYTATAGNGTRSVTTGSVSGDICPAGWRLPTSEADGDYVALNNALNNGATSSDTGLRTYPANFIYSGDYNTAVSTGRGKQARFWSATAFSAANAYRLGYSATQVTPRNNWQKWDAFSVRCIAKDSVPAVTGTIHYEGNGASGTMTDDANVNLYRTAAKANAFDYGDHHLFVEWNTQADGSGTSVKDGDLVAEAAEAEATATGGTLTLYALWGDEATLTYDATGGDGAPEPMTVVGTNGSYTFTVSAQRPTRIDYGFVGWSLDPEAETADYMPSDTFTTNNLETTLYAVWRPVACNAGKLCYRGNGANEGTIISQDASSGATLGLLPSDFSKTGYGFTGWNTKDDGSGTNYGPIETITVGDTSEEGEILYANWVASEGNMQEFSRCSEMNTGDITALTDTRDNNTYAIAKLADGNCWMMENLRLDPSAVTISSSNTNLPTSTFVTEASASSSTSNFCTANTNACINAVAFNTNGINRSLTASYNANNLTSSWFSYGVLYNWYTATAGNGSTSVITGDVTGDICPAGWRLPTGGSGGEFEALNNIVNNGSLRANTGLRTYPVSFVYGGDINGTKVSGRGTYARYWSATTSDANNAFRLGFNATEVTPLRAYNKWDAFAVRCVAK